jgi:hypothetical protein
MEKSSVVSTKVHPQPLSNIVIKNSFKRSQRVELVPDYYRSPIQSKYGYHRNSRRATRLRLNSSP